MFETTKIISLCPNKIIMNLVQKLLHLLDQKFKLSFC